jgi:MFS family permease
MLPLLNGVLGLSAALVFPVSQASILEKLPMEERGAATGVWGMIMSLGGTIGLFILSLLVSILSIKWVFWFSAIFTTIMVLIIILMSRYYDI